jgi:hypothetical protein
MPWWEGWGAWGREICGKQVFQGDRRDRRQFDGQSAGRRQERANLWHGGIVSGRCYSELALITLSGWESGALFDVNQLLTSASSSRFRRSRPASPASLDTALSHWKYSAARSIRSRW